MRKFTYTVFLFVIGHMVLFAIKPYYLGVHIQGVLFLIFIILLIALSFMSLPKVINQHSKRWISVLALILMLPSAIILPTHFFFMIFHWPYANVLSIVSIVLGIIGFIGVTLLLYKKGTAYSMFILMAFLFVNLINLDLSSEYFNMTSRDNDLINEVISMSYESAYESPEPLRGYYERDSLSIDTSSAYSTEIKKVQNYSNNLVDYIQDLKNEFIITAGFKVNETGDTILREPKNIQYSTFFFLNKGKGVYLQDSIQNTKRSLLQLIMDKDERKSLSNAIFISANDSSIPAYEGQQKTWVEYTFADIPAIAAVTILRKIQRDMRNTEDALINYFKRKMDS